MIVDFDLGYRNATSLALIAGRSPWSHCLLKHIRSIHQCSAVTVCLTKQRPCVAWVVQAVPSSWSSGSVLHPGIYTGKWRGWEEKVTAGTKWEKKSIATICIAPRQQHCPTTLSHCSISPPSSWRWASGKRGAKVRGAAHRGKKIQPKGRRSRPEILLICKRR